MAKAKESKERIVDDEADPEVIKEMIEAGDVVAMYKAMRALEPPLINTPSWTMNTASDVKP